MFYLGKHSGRKLQWQSTLGHAVLKAEFKEVADVFNKILHERTEPNLQWQQILCPAGKKGAAGFFVPDTCAANVQ